MDLEGTVCESIDYISWLNAGCCEYGNEVLGAMKSGEFLD
jgi:hypothetical protein